MPDAAALQINFENVTDGSVAALVNETSRSNEIPDKIHNVEVKNTDCSLIYLMPSLLFSTEG